MSSTGSTQTTYRDCRDRLEDAVKTLLIERIAKEHADDVSRKATSAISFEDSACFLQRTMAALNHIALNHLSLNQGGSSQYHFSKTEKLHMYV